MFFKLNHEYLNIVDASQAGAGNLEIIVSVNGKNVPNYVQSEGNAKFRVNFRPTEPQPHLISVKFNNEPVPNSPFECVVRRSDAAGGPTGTPTAAVTGDGIKMCSVNGLAAFAVQASVDDTKNYVVTVTSPSGEELEVTVDKGPDALVAEYQPIEVGPHIVKIMDNARNQNVAGSPYTCNVYDARRVSVTGLVTKQAVGKPLTFTVDASQAGEGNVENQQNLDKPFQKLILLQQVLWNWLSPRPGLQSAQRFRHVAAAFTM